jgi:hypothetical protein
MVKLDAYEMPKPQFVEVEMYNIEWDTEGETPNRTLPPVVTVTVDVNEGNVIAQAIDKATELTGYTLKDLDIRPIDYDNVVESPENFEDTLEFEGEVFDKEKL